MQDLIFSQDRNGKIYACFFSPKTAKQRLQVRSDMKEANMQMSSNLINETNESLINGRLGKKIC